jgi:hypothetical protein
MFEEEIDKEGEISEEETVDESEQDTDTEDSEEDFSEDDSNAEEESDEPVKQKAKMSFGDDGFELISNTDEGEEGFEILAGNEIKKEQSDIIEQSEVTEQSEIIEQTDSETPPEYSAGIEGEGFVIKKTISSELDNEDTDETKEEIDEELHDEMSDEKTDEIDNQEKDYNEKDYDEEEFQESFIEKEVIIEETVLADVIEDKDDNRGAITGEEVSEQYKDYEKTLFEVNELLKDYFLDIESVPEGAASPDGEPVIFGKISELCNLMENRSDTMSFSIISKVYKNTGSIFKEYLKANSRPNEEELIKLNNGINIVEGLIKGDDLPEADDVLASLEALKKSFEDTDVSTVLEDNGDGSEQEEQKEEQKEEGDTTLTDNEKKEIESEQYKENAGVTRKLNEKYSNSELRESFKHMKLQIQDLENTFLALDEIEGDYQNYEGLRKLSSTFLNLKEIIRCAKVLDLKNVAKLSEASYVFIKFIQNYRMNPFDEDIREIFKYIIYNFKAAALDKPNEDLERFISYLNDPVKIFTQKNKRK